MRNESTNFGIYIAHRVNEIRENSSIDDWYYIPTKLNVADELTRYFGFKNLTNQSRWCNGPEFLQQDNINFNKLVNEKKQNKSNKQPEIDTTELNINHLNNEILPKEQTVKNQHMQQPQIINWTYYSSLDKLVRHLTWILKLKSNWVKWKRGSPERENFHFLTVNELNHSRNILFQLSQRESFTNEYQTLASGQTISSKSKLISLYPFFDNELIKVGGRIKHANIPEDSKHQIIVSKDHPLAQLIIRHIHENNHHIGREHTLAIIRQKYWIPACRGVIRKLLRDCIKCKKERALPQETFMGDIPKERLNIGAKPFSNTGVDYGLWSISSQRKSSHKIE